MCKRIAMFNHKGGVSKTTSTYNKIFRDGVIVNLQN